MAKCFPEYAGIPIPIEQERADVEFACGVGRHGEQTMVLQAFHELLRKRPQVNEVMYSSHTIAREPFIDGPEHIQDQVARGARAGFRFMAGLITCINYIRSYSVDLRDFVEQNEELLPLRSQDEQIHVENTLRGDIVADSRNGTIVHPHDVVDYEAEKYIGTSLVLKNVVAREETKIAEMFTPHKASEFNDYANEPQGYYSSGFTRGVYDAFCMYLQSYDHRTIAQTEEQVASIPEPISR